MKRVVIFGIGVYHTLFSPALHSLTGTAQGCRYSPSCSEFAILHIQSDGVVKGGLKTLRRLLYCQPFAKELPQDLRS